MNGHEFSYQEAFCRNLGLISPEEQDVLSRSRVAVAGQGGVGGVDAVTLARLGVGRFHIADPDVFELKNANRQYGATRSTYGRNKAEVMAEILTDINPKAQIRVFKEPLGAHNAAEFLGGVDLLVDGIDAFEIPARRALFRQARAQRIFGIGAGPVGFGTVWVNFSPQGMAYDDYFDFTDGLADDDLFARYIIGMAPAALQRKYLDLAHLNVPGRHGPSAALACQLAAGVIGAEAVKILLGRGQVLSAPYYHQFDAYLGRYARGRLRRGNRGFGQRLKRRWLLNHIRKHK